MEILHIALMGMLWIAFCEYFVENWDKLHIELTK